MGMFLNSIAPYEGYREIARARFFVDKSSLIDELISAVKLDGQRYFCITRPRRFGKSVMANMIGAFFGRTADEKDIFDTLEIARSSYYGEYVHNYDVIYIDFSRLPRDCSCYEQYISRIQNGINEDLAEAYPELKPDAQRAVWDNLQAVFEKNRTRFIFVMDEWDAIFHKSFITEDDKKNYLEFLSDLLKGQGYVGLAYMTGVLPIAKYSSGSEMNMFKEYDMVTKEKFSEYFGFLDSEVDRLFAVYQQTTPNAKITREELAKWYDGYHTAAGVRMYNPHSIVCSLRTTKSAIIGPVQALTMRYFITSAII